MKKTLSLLVQVLLFSFLFIFSVYFVEASEQRQHEHDKDTKSHEEAKNRNLSPKVICWRVIDNPNYNILHLRDLTLDGVTRLCCTCNPGERLVKLCFPGIDNQDTTDCRECDDGTYRPHYSHSYTECIPDTNTCPKEEVYIPSNKTTAPECHCREDKGLFRAVDGTCMPHSRCKPGEGVKIPGTPFDDTVCVRCHRGYISPASSATERCHLDESFVLPPKNQHEHTPSPHPVTPFDENSQSTTSSPTKTDVKDEEEEQQRDGGGCAWYVCFIFLILGFAIAVLLLLLIILYKCWRKRRQGEYALASTQ